MKQKRTTTKERMIPTSTSLPQRLRDEIEAKASTEGRTLAQKLRLLAERGWAIENSERKAA